MGFEDVRIGCCVGHVLNVYKIVKTVRPSADGTVASAEEYMMVYYFPHMKRLPTRMYL
jgi:hypothetical protein